MCSSDLDVHRGEADVSDVINALQPLHDPVAEAARGDFPLAADTQAIFDVVNKTVDFIDADRTLFDGAQKAIAQFFCREGLPLAVLFNHHRQRDFCCFVGSEAGGAIRIDALAPTADFATVGDEARIDDAGVGLMADGAMQGTPPLAVHRKFSAEAADFFAHGEDGFLVVNVIQDVADPGGDLLRFGLLEAARGNGRCADADTAGDEIGRAHV